MSLIRLIRRLPAEEDSELAQKLARGQLSRRSFLFLGAAAAGGLIIRPTLSQIADLTVPAGRRFGMSRSGIDAILKEYYEPPLVELIQARNPLMSMWENEPTDFVAFDVGVNDAVHGRCPPAWKQYQHLVTADRRYSRPTPEEDPYAIRTRPRPGGAVPAGAAADEPGAAGRGAARPGRPADPYPRDPGDRGPWWD